MTWELWCLVILMVGSLIVAPFFHNGGPGYWEDEDE